MCFTIGDIEMAYDDANATVRREYCTGSVGAGNAVSVGHFLHFQKCKLKAIHGRVTVAGTSDAPGHKFDVYIGSSSVATFGFGTSTVGVSSSVTLGSSLTALNDGVYLKTGTDATGKAVFTYEYEVDHDAVRT
jgi:hypothetical protein